jgi:hypothetical protein
MSSSGGTEMTINDPLDVLDDLYTCRDCNMKMTWKEWNYFSALCYRKQP